MDLRKATISNVKWSFIESFSLKFISFILSIILARLLTPNNFGVLAIVNVFYLLTQLFVDGGLKEALIQKKEASSIHFSSVFWVNIGISGCLYLGLFCLAPYIENFYGYSNLSFYIRLQSITLIIESFGIVQIAKAIKDLNLKKITKARIPASLLSFFVGIVLAFYGYGVLALIIQQLVNAFIYTCLLLFQIRYRPQFIINWKIVKQLYHFGIKILGVSLLSRFYVQSLNLLYARFYTPHLLGLYTKSNSMQSVPIELVNSTFLKGLYPSLVHLQDNIEKLRSLFMQNMKIIFYIMLFINGIFFFKTHEIVKILLGDNWIDSVIYLKILSIGSLFYPIVNQTQSILKVRNKVNIYFRIELISKMIMIIVVAIGIFRISLSLPQILSIVVGLGIIVFFVYFLVVSRILKFSFTKEVILIILKFSVASILGLSFNLFLDCVDNVVLNLLSYILLYTIIGIVLLFIFDKQLINKLRKRC